MNILIFFTVLLIGKTKSNEIEFKNTLPINRVNFNEEVLFRNRDNVCINPEKYGFSEKLGTRKYFLISELLMTWSKGENYCQSFGAHLPIIKSQEENNYLRTLIGRRVWTQAEYGIAISPYSGYWLGAYKSVETNTFKWIDNSPWTFTNWKTNEPSFDGKIQFFVHDIYNMISSEYEGWDDQSDWIHSFVICQLDCSSTNVDLLNLNRTSTITQYGSYKFRIPYGITNAALNENFIYLTDRSNGHIIMLNQNGSLMKLVNHSNPFGIASSNNELFVSSWNPSSITKYDLNLNLIQTITNCSFTGAVAGHCLQLPKGLFYDLNSNLLYCADHGVHVFDNNLTRINFISLNFFNSPYSVLYFNNQLYVGTSANQILVIASNSITTTYSNLCSTSKPIHSIYIYNQQYLLFNCQGDSIIPIYHLNMTSTGKYLSTSGQPFSITSDPQNRLLVANFIPGGIDIFSNQN